MIHDQVLIMFVRQTSRVPTIASCMQCSGSDFGSSSSGSESSESENHDDDPDVVNALDNLPKS